MAKKMTKESDKSSVTNNHIGTGGGNSTLTGKNPFAILKASAIASVQSATFPNNFQNLPKVSPPFLNPPKPEDSKYCLVLDLDETLIHNVEVSPYVRIILSVVRQRKLFPCEAWLHPVH